MKQVEDHWPECPYGEEHRLMQYERQQKKVQEARVAAVTHNIIHVLSKDVMLALGDAEILYIHALFEREKLRRAL